jgi:hypothetical protein
MRAIDEASLAALEGSRPADTLTVWAWRGGRLVVPEPLDVLNASFQDDAGDRQTVNERISLTVADPDGTLGAWKFDDPLGVGGSRVQIVYRIGGANALNYGWYRVEGNEPDEVVEWREVAEYGLDEPDSDTAPHTRLVPIVRAVVKLQVVDITSDVDRDTLEGPESPAPGRTVLSEFARLNEGHFPVVVDPGVNDTDVSPFLILEGNRLQAGQDLLSRVNARYRMGGDGECHVYPLTGPSVLTVEPGKCLVQVSRKQSIDGLYNRWTVEGKDGDHPVVASVDLEYGPLRYGGDHGRAPAPRYTSEMITNYQQALAYALELRAKFLATLAVELSVELSPRPELQAGDRITVGCPVSARHVAYFPGTITSIRRGFSPAPTITSLTLSCSYSDVSTALSRTMWAANLTRSMPPLTWDRMPGTWGTAPAMPWDDLP